LVFSFLGYQSVEKAFAIEAGESITINEIMSAEEGVSLEEVVIKSFTSKETASALMLEQKKGSCYKNINWSAGIICKRGF